MIPDKHVIAFYALYANSHSGTSFSSEDAEELTRENMSKNAFIIKYQKETSTLLHLLDNLLAQSQLNSKLCILFFTIASVKAEAVSVIGSSLDVTGSSLTSSLILHISLGAIG